MAEGTGRLGRDAGRVLAWAGAAVVIAFTAAPLLYMISLSLDPDPVGAPSWPPRISLINYEILASPDFAFFPALRLSVLLTTGTTLVSLLVAIPGAYALARLGMRSASWILPAMLALAFFPGVIVLVTMRRQLAEIGLLDTLPGIGLAQLSFTVPLAVWFLTYAFRQVSDEIEDAARLDGAGARQRIVHIILPIARPGLAATTALVFLASWSDYLFSSGLSQTSNARRCSSCWRSCPRSASSAGRWPPGCSSVCRSPRCWPRC